MIAEGLADARTWFRLADPTWADPLDAGFAARAGGRWNPPGSHRTLYLNEDVVTARINLQLHMSRYPYGPEDLAEDGAPVLVHARLPRAQVVLDVHTPVGVAAVGLPVGYPLEDDGSMVGHDVCRPLGVEAHAAGLRGVRCRSARAVYGAGRELAWFPVTARSRAREVERQPFAEWFWG